MKTILTSICFIISIWAPAQTDSLYRSNDSNKTVVHHVPKYIETEVNCCVGGPPVNDNFAGATTLVVNAAAINGTTCGATVQVGESKDCNTTANQTVWYNFIATATTTYVVINVNGTGTGCYSGSQIWSNSTLPTGSCHPISCQSADYGPNITVHQLQTVIGNTYYVQILYGTGGFCGTGGCFKINATNINPGGITNAISTNTCATANNTCWFTSPPTVAQVTTGCTQYIGPQAANIVNCSWFQFTTGANSSTISLNALINSFCGSGTIDWFDWTLYDNSCNIISCGTFPTLSITGAACNTTYKIEFCWETAGCTWNNWYWYFNAPAAPPPCGVLPVELISFAGICNGQYNCLNWSCATETNNNYFELQRSLDAVEFVDIARIQGVGNSIYQTNYAYNDLLFTKDSINYYRLKQVDFNGNYRIYDIISIDDKNIHGPTLIDRITILGTKAQIGYEGIYVEIYSDGSYKKKIGTIK